MPAFKDTEELNKVMLTLWQALQEDKHVSSELLKSKLVVTFCYKDPDSKITVDCSGSQLKAIVGNHDLKSVVEMSMKADLAHEFWLGKVNLPLALISGKISSKGPVHSALALLPVIKPAYNLYPSIYKAQTGRG